MKQILQLIDELKQLNDDIHDGVYVFKNLREFAQKFKEVNSLIQEDQTTLLRLKLTDPTAYDFLIHAEQLNLAFDDGLRPYYARSR